MVFIISPLFCQLDLIPNPDFEITDDWFFGCTQNCSNPAKDWYTPSLATPDHLQTCSPVVSFCPVNIPNHNAGYSYAYSGEGMSGGYMWGTTTQTAYREYIQTELKESLKKDHTYYFEFYVKLANRSLNGIAEIGALFHAQPITHSMYQYLGVYSPQVVSDSITPIIDTVSWTKISGEFLAVGDEKYLTLGYHGDGNVQFQQIQDTSQTTLTTSYYYMDACYIEDRTDSINSDIDVPNVFTPNGDGVNDFFKLIEIQGIDRYSISIYNRWGNTVFESKNPTDYWDGTSNGIKCANGTYYYHIKAKGLDQESILKKGYITLLR